MPELKYQPVLHDHIEFLARAAVRRGFVEAYDALDLERQVIDQLLKARTQAGLTQDAVAARMGTTKSAVSRLESGGKHTPSLTTLRRYAAAVGCDLHVTLTPRKSFQAGARARLGAGCVFRAGISDNRVCEHRQVAKSVA